MSYTPTEWKTGDIITAEKLNKAEQGVKDANVLQIIDYDTLMSGLSEDISTIYFIDTDTGNYGMFSASDTDKIVEVDCADISTVVSDGPAILYAPGAPGFAPYLVYMYLCPEAPDSTLEDYREGEGDAAIRGYTFKQETLVASFCFFDYSQQPNNVLLIPKGSLRRVIVRS